MTSGVGSTPEPEQTQFSVFEIWVGRVVAAIGLVLLVASMALLVLAGLDFGRTIPGALVYGGIPLAEGCLVAYLLAKRRIARATAAVWLCDLLNFWLFYTGWIGGL